MVHLILFFLVIFEQKKVWVLTEPWTRGSRSQYPAPPTDERGFWAWSSSQDKRLLRNYHAVLRRRFVCLVVWFGFFYWIQRGFGRRTCYRKFTFTPWFLLLRVDPGLVFTAIEPAQVISRVWKLSIPHPLCRCLATPIMQSQVVLSP